MATGSERPGPASVSSTPSVASWKPHAPRSTASAPQLIGFSVTYIPSFLSSCRFPWYHHLPPYLAKGRPVRGSLRFQRVQTVVSVAKPLESALRPREGNLCTQLRARPPNGGCLEAGLPERGEGGTHAAEPNYIENCQPDSSSLAVPRV